MAVRASRVPQALCARRLLRTRFPPRPCSPVAKCHAHVLRPPRPLPPPACARPVPGLCSRVPFVLRVPLLPAKSRFEHPLLGNATLTSSLFPTPPPRGPRRLPGGVAPGGRPCPAAGLCEVRDVAARARPGGALLEPSPGHGDAAGMRGTLSASPPSLRKCGLAPETCSPRKALGTVLVGPVVPGFLRQNRENEREGQGQGHGGGPVLVRAWAALLVGGVRRRG